MKRALRGVAGTALMVVSSFVAGPVAPAAAATSCLTVPATTPGFTVGIGGTPQRIPSFSGISVCASTPDGSPVAPAVSNSVGGACAASCTTVSLQVSPLDLGPLSVTYVQDGVTNRHAVDPEAVGTSQGICLVSTGTPQAPVPSCTLSLGSDQDLTGTVAGLVSQVTTLVNQTIAQVKPIVDDAVADAVALANQLGPQAKAIVDDALADAVALANQLGPQAKAIVDDAVADATVLANQTAAQAKVIVDDAVVRATTLAAGLRATAEQTAASLVATGCNSVPDGPNGQDACTNPAGWTTATALQTASQARAIVDDAVADATVLVAGLRRTVEETAASLVTTGCNSVPDGPNGQDACTNPVAWTSATAFGLVSSTCNSVPDGPYGEDACTDPDAWASAVAAQKWAEIDEEIRRRFQPVCDRVPDAGDGSEFCGGADLWAQWFIDRLTNAPLMEEIQCTVDPDSCWW